MPKRLLFSGSSLGQALLQASRRLRLDPEQIAYVDRSRQSGFLAGPRVVIEVDPRSPLRQAQPAEPRTAAPSSTRTASRDAGRPRSFAQLSPAREAELAAWAARTAALVQATGETFVSELLNPAERRIVHATIADCGLRTESLGEDRMKQIRVYSAGPDVGPAPGGAGADAIR